MCDNNRLNIRSKVRKGLKKWEFNMAFAMNWGGGLACQRYFEKKTIV